MNRLYKTIIFSATAAFAGVIFMNSASGPGTNLSANVTGAPFDAGTCTACHSGSPNFGSAVNLQLLDGASPVTSYTPGKTYTLRINRSATGTPAGFGFQITSATAAGNINAGTWGTLPANTQSWVNNGHTYIEHSTMLSTSLTNVDIPWTAPAAGTGTVRFYAALNTVNGNSSENGDEVKTASLTVTQSPVSVRNVVNADVHGLHYVNGNNVVLQLSLTKSTEADILLQSLDGRVVAQTHMHLQGGENTVKLDRPQVAGIYIISVADSRQLLYKGKVLNP